MVLTRVKRVRFEHWLWNIFVLIIIRIISCVFVALCDFVIERWEKGSRWAAFGGPFPSVRHWLHAFQDRQALVDQSGGVSVLMAHFDDYSSVDDLLILESVVAGIESDKSLFVCFEPEDVVGNLVLVVLDVTSVFRDFRLVLVAESLGVDNSVLEVGSRKSERLSRNEHICRLSDLELEVLSTEKGLVGIAEVEVVDRAAEAWQSEVRAGSGTFLCCGSAKKES